MRTLVVTDSTAYIPADYAARLGIEIIPLQVLIGDKSYEEGGEGAEAILTALRQGVLATTSKPTPERFLETYRRAAAAGFDAVVSIHLSKAISGTYDSALVAASQVSIPVHVVDSKSLAMGLGFAAISAAHAAEEGLDATEIAQIATSRAHATISYFTVATLEQLRRSGRISRGKALVASALAIRPILTIEDGEIVAFEKVRTSTKAIERLEELAIAAAMGRSVDIAIHHLGALELANTVSEWIQGGLAEGGLVSEVIVSEVGAVVGAHTGPGMIAVVISPRI
jgi:DegV family protein with EDD domain